MDHDDDYVCGERADDRRIERKRRTLGHLGALDPNLGAVKCKYGERLDWSCNQLVSKGKECYITVLREDGLMGDDECIS